MSIHTPSGRKDMPDTRFFDRRDFLKGVAGGIAAALSGGSGCGGGRATGGSGTPGGGTPGTPVTPAARAAAQKAVEDWLTEAAAAGTVSDQAAIDFLKARSEFAYVGSVHPGGAWARFTDGQLLVVSYNLDPELGRSRDDCVPQFVTRAANSELPVFDRVRILNALGTAFSPPHADIRSWMVKHGYTIVSDDASVNGLSSVNGEGVFYINSHGNHGVLEDNTTIWGLWTADKVSDAQDDAFKDLLKSGALIKFSAIHDKSFFGGDPNNPRGNAETHYAITARFLREYNWKFSDNSLVFINCCWSGDAEFQNECLNRNASAYGGWSNAAAPTGAWRCARFVFDRLLGQLKTGNQEFPEPGGLQRGFDAGAVIGDLSSRGWNVTNHPKWGQATFSLFSKAGGGDFGLLAPTIQQVDVNEYEGQLILKGEFGTDNPVNAHFVSVGGNDVRIIEWKKDTIKCDLPLNAFGDVQVRVGVRKSNIRRITRWDIDITYRMSPPGTPFEIAGNIPLRFRADIDQYRRHPADSLQSDIRYAVLAKGSDATMAATGTQTSGDCTTTWSKTITWKGGLYDGSATTSVVSRLKIDPKTRTGALGLGFGIVPPTTPYLQTVVCPPPVGTQLSDIAPTFGPLDGPVTFKDPLAFAPDIQLLALNLIFETDYSIREKTYVDPSGLITFSWAATPAKSPPDPDAARSPEPSL